MEGIIGLYAAIVETAILAVVFFLLAIAVLGAIAFAAYRASKHRGEGRPEVGFERKSQNEAGDEDKAHR